MLGANFISNIANQSVELYTFFELNTIAKFLEMIQNKKSSIYFRIYLYAELTKIATQQNKILEKKLKNAVYHNLASNRKLTKKKYPTIKRLDIIKRVKPQFRKLKKTFNSIHKNIIKYTTMQYTEYLNEYKRRNALNQDSKTSILTVAKQLANEGIRAEKRKNNTYSKVESVVEQNTRSGINKAVGNISIDLMKKLGFTVIETSAHVDARNTGNVPENHELWQGKWFSFD